MGGSKINSGSTYVIVLIFLLVSCLRETEILNETDTQNVDAVVASSSYVSEGADMSANTINGLSSTQLTGGRIDAEFVTGLGDKDDRLKCATVSITRTGTKAYPEGTITITFDPTCADKHGVKRSGSIVINYKGKRWAPGSNWSLVFKDFYRNNNHIEGTESVTTQLSSDSLHLQFQAILSGGKVTFHDNKSITREHNLIFEWFRASLPINDEWHSLAGGTANGTNKKGYSYQMVITKDLVQKNSCRASKVFIPVSGTKEITVNASGGTKKYKVEYGDGTCDNMILVVINGKQKAVTVNNDGN